MAENPRKQITNLNGGDPEAAGLEQDADAAGRHPLPQPAHHPARHQHVLHPLQSLHSSNQNHPNQSHKYNKKKTVDLEEPMNQSGQRSHLCVVELSGEGGRGSSERLWSGGDDPVLGFCHGEWMA